MALTVKHAAEDGDALKILCTQVDIGAELYGEAAAVAVYAAVLGKADKLRGAVYFKRPARSLSGGRAGS